MKLGKKSITEAFRSSVKVGILFVVLSAIIIEVSGIIQYHYARDGIREEAALRAEGELEAAKMQVRDVINQVETAVRNSVWMATWTIQNRDSLSATTRVLVEENPVIVGSSVALLPDAKARRKPFMQMNFRDSLGKNATRVFRDISDYDYTVEDWFTKPVSLGTGYWSEPYISQSDSNDIVTTFSLPIRNTDGVTVAVLSASVSLNWLTALVENIKVYPNAYSLVISRAGQIMVSPAETLNMRKNIFDIIGTVSDTASAATLTRAFYSGESGNVQIMAKGKPGHVFFSPVKETGWYMSLVIPDDEVYSTIQQIGGIVLLMQLLGLVALFLIIRSVYKNGRKYKDLSENNSRMENELRIARGIQMSMVPKVFPPFPERSDIDMAAALFPAKEVSGDLYDSYIRDEKLFFCIGDVSGKGVPASLLMAVARSMFRTVSAHEDHPGKIVSAMNDSMSDMNENNMFVTFFCGMLDLGSGLMLYCNAGHNAPRLLRKEIAPLPVVPNLPLGVIAGAEFVEQEITLLYDDAIFLYTDGLTEAENERCELFGEERMDIALRDRKPSMDYLKSISASVDKFVGGANRSDDLTMLYIHYLNDTSPSAGHHRIILSNDIQQIPRLAGFVEEVVAESSAGEELTSSLSLALEEAVTNVIMYAYPKDMFGTVQVDAVNLEDAIRFIVTDSGTAFDPTQVPDADVHSDLGRRKIGGLGIFLVRKIMDKVRYERKDGRNILYMTKNL